MLTNKIEKAEFFSYNSFPIFSSRRRLFSNNKKLEEQIYLGRK